MMEYIGSWRNGKDIPLVQLESGVYALYGWNGERYTECWKCTGEFLMDASKERYELKPIYAGDLIPGFWESHEEDDSDEWESAVQIVDYEIGSGKERIK
jgi:hypothetical protein